MRQIDATASADNRVLIIDGRSVVSPQGKRRKPRI
jgi:hypothetical protein